jgi:hypothetical protein
MPAIRPTTRKGSASRVRFLMVKADSVEQLG